MYVGHAGLYKEYWEVYEVRMVLPPSLDHLCVDKNVDGYVDSVA